MSPGGSVDIVTRFDDREIVTRVLEGARGFYSEACDAELKNAWSYTSASPMFLYGVLLNPSLDAYLLYM